MSGTYTPSAVPEADVNYLSKMSGITLADPIFDIVLIPGGPRSFG
jgi:hypothetical protein